MKTTTYEWNTFEEAKPFDGDVILVRHKFYKLDIHICKFKYPLEVRKFSDRLTIDNLDEYKWANLDDDEFYH